MISISDKSECCGCLACYNACPADAIVLKKDIGGFVYPLVDKDKCVDCHLCEKACDFNSSDREFNIPSRCFSLEHKNRSVLINSTSGGAFTAISDLIIRNGGIVAGTMMDDRFNIVFTEANDAAGRDKMRGSLYVQSNPDTIYRRAQEHLNNGMTVLFVGTPCQVGAMQRYIKKNKNNLICVEFLCHGVPSNEFFKEHIKYLERMYHSKAQWYTFRSKKFAWWTHGIEEITFENGAQKATQAVQTYNTFFHSNVSLRPSCLNCSYRRLERSSDITIADFWGIEKITGKKNRKGVSLVLGNTEKGIALLEKIDMKNVDMAEVNFEKVKYRISTKPAKSKIDTNEFWRIYADKGYDGIVQRYISKTFLGGGRFLLKKMVSRNYFWK